MILNVRTFIDELSVSRWVHPARGSNCSSSTSVPHSSQPFPSFLTLIDLQSGNFTQCKIHNVVSISLLRWMMDLVKLCWLYAISNFASKVHGSRNIFALACDMVNTRKKIPYLVIKSLNLLWFLY